MPTNSASLAVLASGAAAATYLASNAFVGAPPAARSPALRGSSLATDVAAESVAEAPGSSTQLAACGALLMGASAVSASRSKQRSTRRALPSVAVKEATEDVPRMTPQDEPEQPQFEIFDPSKQIGVTAPFGYFDPAGIANNYDEYGFRALRVCEIKHGRVAMMASIGLVGQHFVHFPGFDKVPSGVNSCADNTGIIGMAVLTAICGYLELSLWRDDQNREPGNYGDPFGVNMYNEDMRNKELNNGRAAMIATTGIMVAEVISGKDAIQQLGF